MNLELLLADRLNFTYNMLREMAQEAIKDTANKNDVERDNKLLPKAKLELDIISEIFVNPQANEIDEPWFDLFQKTREQLIETETLLDMFLNNGGLGKLAENKIKDVKFFHANEIVTTEEYNKILSNLCVEEIKDFGVSEIHTGCTLHRVVFIDSSEMDVYLNSTLVSTDNEIDAHS